MDQVRLCKNCITDTKQIYVQYMNLFWKLCFFVILSIYFIFKYSMLSDHKNLPRACTEFKN